MLHGGSKAQLGLKGNNKTLVVRNEEGSQQRP